MTADFDSIPILEECDTVCKGFMDCVGLNTNDFINSPYKKPPSFEPYQMMSNAFYESEDFSYDLPSLGLDMEWDSPSPFITEYPAPTESFKNAFIHSENESDFFNIVDPVSCLPLQSPVKEEYELKYDQNEEKFTLEEESLESALGTNNLMDLTDERLLKIMDNVDCSDYVSLDDIFMKQPKRFTHLDFDHCYSIRPPGYDYYVPPPSPSSSSCSDKTAKIAKRGRPPKKNIACKKIKQEPISEDEDVESPYPVPLVVPKITLALSPPPSPPTPPKRGRKPKNKSQGQKNKKAKNKNCPVPPKVLEEAIKQQKKKNYVTKSGRVTKISHSVESSPSTSTQSSQSSSRCSSDIEDTADKRASHNMAERQRRQQLTDLFQILRKRVPTTMSNPKASKVAILTEAAKCVVGLEDISRMKKLCKDQQETEITKRISIIQSFLGSR